MNRTMESVCKDIVAMHSLSTNILLQPPSRMEHRVIGATDRRPESLWAIRRREGFREPQELGLIHGSRP